MDNKFDLKAIISITAGTIILILLNIYSGQGTVIKSEWVIQACSVVVVIIAAIYGMAAGMLVPFAACTIYGVAMRDPLVSREIIFLVFGGMVTGHYRDKFMVYKGGFDRPQMVDFAVIETAVAIIAWICMYPLGGFLLKLVDIGTSLKNGLTYCGVCILAKLCICLPVLLMFNKVFRKKRLIEDARKEYLYDRK